MNGGPDEPPRILLAADDAQLRDILRLEVLTWRRGARVVTAAGGCEALVCLGRHDPHLLLLELMMPGLDGFGIVWELDRHGLLPARRIIVLTMMGPAEIARRGGLPPGVGLLAHPLDRGALHAALDQGMAAIPAFR